MLRRFLQSSLLALVAATPFTARAASASGVLEVVTVQSTRVADLVLMDHGFDAGLRHGMVCRVTHDRADIAEILLVERRPTCSAALLLSLAPGQSIRAGDHAAIKLLKT